MKNKSLLLTLIAVLALTRFVFIPAFENQSEQVTQIKMTSQQLSRAEALIAAEDELLVMLEETEALNRAMFAEIPAVNSASQGRLQLQQQLNRVIAETEASVHEVNWLGQESAADDQLIVYRARVVLQGNARQLMHAHTVLEAEMKFARIDELNLQEQQNIPGVRDGYRLQLLLSLVARSGGGG